MDWFVDQRFHEDRYPCQWLRTDSVDCVGAFRLLFTQNLDRFLAQMSTLLGLFEADLSAFCAISLVFEALPIVNDPQHRLRSAQNSGPIQRIERLFKAQKSSQSFRALL